MPYDLIINFWLKLGLPNQDKKPIRNAKDQKLANIALQCPN